MTGGDLNLLGGRPTDAPLLFNYLRFPCVFYLMSTHAVYNPLNQFRGPPGFVLLGQPHARPPCVCTVTLHAGVFGNRRSLGGVINGPKLGSTDNPLAVQMLGMKNSYVFHLQYPYPSWTLTSLCSGDAFKAFITVFVLASFSASSPLKRSANDQLMVAMTRVSKASS